MLRLLTLITAIFVIWFTALVSVPGSPYLIGGMTQADISNMFPTAITPAGVTFAIWSVIYLSWLIAWLVISWIPVTKLIKKYFPKMSVFLTTLESKKVIYSFSFAILLTAFWLIPWGYQMIGTALIVMLVILGLLKYAFHHTRKSSPLVKWSVELTLGWINIATVANITIWLVSLGFRWGNISETYWAIGVLGLALILTAYYQCRYRAYIISLVFLWTLYGVWIAHPIFEQRVTVGIYAIVTMVNMLYSFSKKK
jgi:hypothetical protein